MKRLGTFEGVFTPALLTILGVIMYLRLGWVVGQAGLMGALAIVLLAQSVTLATSLSIASMVTNIRIGAGGAYSIISRSLGVEAGGSIGISFYFAQTLSASLYIVGFTEVWMWLFPTHVPLYVSFVVWIILATVSTVSTRLAIRSQYVIMAVIFISLISFFLTPSSRIDVITVYNNAALGFKEFSFWQIFAVFFPAVTGLMAGTNLSGELKDPRRSLPKGTISAVVISMIIYVGLTIFLAFYIPEEQLKTNSLAMIENARWPILVVFGVMGATLSSALVSIVGAPRILQALAEEQTIPFHGWFGRSSNTPEPRVAIVITSIIIAAGLLVGKLNVLASLLTMFFLITYGMLNFVVFTEQSMKMLSFRPMFRIPRIISLYGALGCFVCMFLIDMLFTIAAFVIVALLYFWLGRRELEGEFRDVRGGLFQVVAERATRLATRLPKNKVSWKPDLLLPVDNPDFWQVPMDLVSDIVFPYGSLYAYTVKKKKDSQIELALTRLLEPIEDRRVLASSAIIEADNFVNGSRTVMQTLRGAPLHPNTLFLTMGVDNRNDGNIRILAQEASSLGMGLMLLRLHKAKSFGGRRVINLWLRDLSPNWHLAMLTAIKLQHNWEGRINLISVAGDHEQSVMLGRFLDRLSDHARLPAQTELIVITDSFDNAMRQVPEADINIFGIARNELAIESFRRLPDLTNTTCIFVRNSGFESALV